MFADITASACPQALGASLPPPRRRGQQAISIRLSASCRKPAGRRSYPLYDPGHSSRRSAVPPALNDRGADLIGNRLRRRLLAPGSHEIDINRRVPTVGEDLAADLAAATGLDLQRVAGRQSRATHPPKGTGEDAPGGASFWNPRSRIPAERHPPAPRLRPGMLVRMPAGGAS